MEEARSSRKSPSLQESRSQFADSVSSEISSAIETITDDEKLTKAYLESIKGTIEPVDVHGDFTLTWTTGPYSIRVVFPKEANDPNDEQDDMEEFGDEGEREESPREVKARDNEDEDFTDEEDGSAPKFNPHSFHIDVKTAGSDVFTRINAMAAKDGTCVIETVCFPDLAKEEKFKQSVLSGSQQFGGRSEDFQGNMLSLADLTEELATSFFSFLERLRIDDELAQFVQHYSLYASRAQHVDLLKTLKTNLLPK